MLRAILDAGGDRADLPFWEACEEHRFVLQRCDVCEQHYWPASRCVVHGDCAMRWIEVSGRGTIHTYTVQHHAYTAAMMSRVPYAVIVAKLDEGPFFHSNLLDCPLPQLKVGLPVEIAFAQHEKGLTIPIFRLHRT